MPVSPTYPGVYVQEVPSGVRTIAGVATSITLFVGRSKSGPIGSPERCLNYTEFKKKFGDDTSLGDLARQVKLFFLNGGTDCYVMRIAKNAAAATITLQNENKKDTLVLEARNAGVGGNAIRAIVTYAGQYPEATFNLELFRWDVDSTGARTKADTEKWTNLSMDPASAGYAPTVLTQKSALVKASEPLGAPAAINGYSLSGAPIEFASPGPDNNALALAFRDALVAMMGTGTDFMLSVDGKPPVLVQLGPANLAAIAPGAATIAAMMTAIGGAIKARVDAAMAAFGPGAPTVTVDFPVGPATTANFATRYLRISSAAAKDIHADRAPNKDVAAGWQLGQDNGGTEVGAHAARRPAPSGLSFSILDWNAPTNVIAATPINHLGGLDDLNGAVVAKNLSTITLDQLNAAGAFVTSNDLKTNTPVATFAWKVAGGIRGVLALIRDAVNKEADGNALFKWRASTAGSRLTVLWTGDENHLPTVFKNAGTDITVPDFTKNAGAYSLGPNGSVGLQSAPVSGNDGIKPDGATYDDAYTIIDAKVDLFNLMVLPADAELTEAERAALWGNASVFCQKRRAFLIMDPKDSWADHNKANNDVGSVRVGLVKDHSAIYFPRLLVPEGGINATVNPAGAMAGLMARTDGTRGVWKAPAGLEADVRGIVGLDLPLSDDQNGVLNPNAINALRLFPDGVVSWGARTNAGTDALASEYKYVPIRRLALFLEESLYRGLKWVVFEPNDEPLWAQIRLNVGAFMHDMFRKGAFQGTKPSDAYFVKCDAETTTQTDRNLGIVNIWVGFAPLKPAEFVILYLQQIAGQILT